MSNRPASCKFVQFVSVLPRREYSMNSRIWFSSSVFVFDVCGYMFNLGEPKKLSVVA